MGKDNKYFKKLIIDTEDSIEERIQDILYQLEASIKEKWGCSVTVCVDSYLEKIYTDKFSELGFIVLKKNGDQGKVYITISVKMD